MIIPDINCNSPAPSTIAVSLAAEHNGIRDN